MVAQPKAYTVEAFDDFVNLPENADKLFEFIGGEIVEVPSNPYSSAIAATILFFFKLFLRENNIAGHITGADGGYIVGQERYAPDVAFISKKRQPELPYHGYNPNPPDLAVEVVSPTDSLRKLMEKVGNYLAVGTVVWVVYPETKEIAVYAPGQPVRIFGIDDTVDGGDVLPGFRLAVKEIFPQP